MPPILLSVVSEIQAGSADLAHVCGQPRCWAMSGYSDSPRVCNAFCEVGIHYCRCSVGAVAPRRRGISSPEEGKGPAPQRTLAAEEPLRDCMLFDTFFADALIIPLSCTEGYGLGVLRIAQEWPDLNAKAHPTRD